MSDIEEEQPTQQRGRRDWDEEGDESASLEGDADLGGRRNLVEAHSATGTRRLSGGRQIAAGPFEERAEDIDREHPGDKNPGGDLSRSGEP